MTVTAVVDALLPLLPAATGVAKDDSGAEPLRSEPNRLYLWPRRFGSQRLEEANGRWDEADLRMRALYTLGNKGEARTRMDRAITEALDAALDAIVEAVAANRRSALWWDIYVEAITYDAVRTETHRGYGVDLVVRLNVPPALG